MFNKSLCVHISSLIYLVAKKAFGMGNVSLLLKIIIIKLLLWVEDLLYVCHSPRTLYTYLRAGFKTIVV